jgi:hypothetical protein
MEDFNPNDPDFPRKLSVHRILMFIFISVSFVACVQKPIRVDIIPSEAIPTITQPACQPSQIQKSRNDFPEIQATMHSEGEIWALLFFGEAHANEELKIVWRATGTGLEFTAEAQHEDGTIILPIWGPEFHESSTWERPGQEWGTGFNFSEPGCWTITVSSGETRGEIILNVLPSRQS